MSKIRNRLIKIILVISGILIFAGVPLTALPQETQAANITVSVTPEYMQSAARSMLKPLNAWRRQKNWYYTSSNAKAWIKAGSLPNLTYDYTLEKFAMLRAAEIAMNFDHIRPNGTTKSGLVGNGYMAFGENIYASTSASAKDPNYVLNRFKEENSKFNNQGHRRNMLSISWTSNGRMDMKYDAVGVGCVKYNGCYYWVQVFGRATKRPNTKAVAAVNAKKTMGVTLNTSMVKRKKNLNFSKVKNASVSQGSNLTLGKAYVDIGLKNTWPSSYVRVGVNPVYTSKKTNVLTISASKAYGKTAGTASVVAKEPITGKTKTISVTVIKAR